VDLKLLLLLLASAAVLLAAIGRRQGWTSSKWLATVGIVAPLVALALTMLDLSIAYRRILVLQGWVGSVELPAPLDQRSTAVASQLSSMREWVGVLSGLIMPIATWVWGRVHWPEQAHRGRRWLALLAAASVTVTTWSIASWSFEFIYIGFVNYACSPGGRWGIDASFELLEQLRVGVIVAGLLLAAFAVVHGVKQARQGRFLSMEGWVPLLAFVGLAAVARLWTSDERRDTMAAFPPQPNGHYNGWEFLKGHADDPYEGPRLDHCTFDWTGMNLLRPNSWWMEREEREQWGEWIDFCTESEGIGPILAEPELAIGNVVPSLKSARDHGYSRFGVASVRPIPTSRATTGEFLRLQTCVVEFAVAEDGIPIQRFATWGELAEAADEAEGALVVALPDDPIALPRSPDPVREPDDESPTLWAPYRAFPER
jgi:hypothetical protein